MSRRLAFDALTLVEEQGFRAGEALEAAQARLGGIDARDGSSKDWDLAREIVQGVLRTALQLDAVLAGRIARPMADQDPDVLRVLRIGTYQVLHLDRVPPWAAVSSAVELAHGVRRSKAAGFVNAVLRRVCDVAASVSADEGPAPRRALPRPDGAWRLLSDDVLPDPGTEYVSFLAARWSVPAWAVGRFVAQRGRAGAEQILAASIARPSLSLRPRPGRDLVLESALRARGFDVDREGTCLLVRGAGAVPELPGFAAGDFAVQDPTAAEVVPALATLPGERILDACAAPGGKTFALAEAVGPSGRVVAADVPGDRLERLRRESVRRGTTNVDVVAADLATPADLPGSPYDAVLLDAPCSNTGVLARRVEARGRLFDGDALRSLVVLQARLLDALARHVRPGGRLLYATCSVDDDENAAQVAAFLARTPGFALESERLTLPVARRRDGGYTAVLRAFLCPEQTN